MSQLCSILLFMLKNVKKQKDLAKKCGGCFKISLNLTGASSVNAAHDMVIVKFFKLCFLTSASKIKLSLYKEENLDYSYLIQIKTQEVNYIKVLLGKCAQVKTQVTLALALVTIIISQIKGDIGHLVLYRTSSGNTTLSTHYFYLNLIF